MSENGSATLAPLARELALEVRELSKEYVLGEHLSLKKTVSALGRRRQGVAPISVDALNEVSFDLRTGRCLGIVGENGSGKSTLLQVLAGITVPDGGRVRIRGLVLPLLEIGAGFHAELTGRENIEVFGTVLGLPRRQIVEATPAVADFSGTGRHLDTPLKRYSSGMRARLSFAVAMRFPADIYIFDEVLAIVDDSFRYRCFEEIEALKRASRTVLFVSHDLPSIREICDECLWLDSGRVRDHGPVGPIADAYEQVERHHARTGG